jgi:hypothetical protein
MIHFEIIDDIISRNELALLEPRKVFDSTIIGLAERGDMLVVAYNTDLVISVLMSENGWTQLAAREWFDFNILNTYLNEGSPVFIDVVS